jgi:hypothetical protein
MCAGYHRRMGEQNKNIYPLSLGGRLVCDLMPEHELRATCKSCGRERPVTVKAIERRIGSLNFVLAAERFLRCSGCGNRKGNRLSVHPLRRQRCRVCADQVTRALVGSQR